MHLIGTADIALQRDSRYSFVDLFPSQSNQPLEGTVSTFYPNFEASSATLAASLRVDVSAWEMGIILHGCRRNQRVAGIVGPDL